MAPALSKNIEFLRAIFNQSAISTVLLDHDMWLSHANEAFCVLSGYNQKKCSVLRLNDILHPDDRDDSIYRIAEINASDTALDPIACRIMGFDGTTRPVLITASRIPDESGDSPVRYILQIVSTLPDMNEIAECRAAEERWRYALEGSQQVVWDFHIPTGMVWVSSHWKTLLDLSDDERIHSITNWLSKMHPDDRERLAAAAGHARTSDNPNFDAIYRLRHTDGRWLWVLSRGKMVEYAPDGTGVRMVGTIVEITHEKEMETNLAALTERLEVALDAGGIGIFDVDFIADWRSWDKRTYELHDITREAFDHTTAGFMKLLHPEDALRIEQIRESALREGTDYQIDYRVMLASPSAVRHIRATIHLIKGPGGEVQRGIGACWDITKDVERTAHLHDTLALLHAVTEGTPDLIYVKDANGRYLLINEAVEKVMAMSNTQIIGRLDSEIFPPLTALSLIENDRRVLQSGEPYTVEETATVDGVLRTYSSTKAPRYDEHGHLAGLIGISRDITDVKSAEAALRKSELRWQFALDGAGDGIWDWDMATGKVFYSHRWKSMLGYEEDEIGSTADEWSSRVHADDLPRCRSTIEEHFSGRTPDFVLEHRMRSKDGSWRWIYDRGKVIERAEDGRPLRVIGTHTDITARKESEEAIVALNQRLQLAIEASGAGIFDLDFSTGQYGWDERMYALYGLRVGKFNGTLEEWLSFIHPDDVQKVMAEYETAVHQTSVFNMDFRIKHQQSGTTHHIRSLARILRDQAGVPLRAVGINWDITDHRELAGALYEQKEQLRITLHSIGDAVIATDAEARITFMNPVAEQMTGWLASDAIGHPLMDVFRLLDEKGLAIPDPVETCLRLSQPFYLDTPAVLVSRDGKRRDIRDSAAPVRIATGEITGAVLVFQDVTKARVLQQALEHSATHDSLTGLPNRVGFERELSKTFEQSQQDGSQHTLCFIDLDRFKLVNDGAGHAAGDALLREVASLLRRSIRSQDIAARLGGDEFALLLQNCPIVKGETIGSQFLRSLARYRFVWEGRTFEIGASMGMVLLDRNAAPLDALMSQADIACYASKSAGRNQISVYGGESGSAVRHHREIQIAADIRDAIENNRFRLYGQEIRNLKSEEILHHHFEILLRMEDADGALIQPDVFIPAAERYDLMGAIDRWVIRTTLRDFGQQLILEDNLSVGINLSANSLSDPFLWSFVQEELLVSNVSPKRIHFEITETALINNVAAARQFITNARSAGCRIVLDDFGNGLSSFTYLREYPVDGIKIDGGFIRGLSSSHVDRTIVESINAIGHRLDAFTIAEQVEDEITLGLVRDIGLDQAQGFAIARPQPLGELF